MNKNELRARWPSLLPDWDVVPHEVQKDDRVRVVYLDESGKEHTIEIVGVCVLASIRRRTSDAVS